MRFPITTRILLGITLILLVGLVSMAEIYAGLATVKGSVKDISEVHEPTTAAAYEMELNASATAVSVLRYLESPEPGLRRQVKAAEGRFRDAGQRYLRLADSPRETELGQKILGRYRAIRVLSAELMDRRDRRNALLPAVNPRVAALDRLISTRLQPPPRSADPAAYPKGVHTMAMQGELDLISTWVPEYLTTRSTELRKRIQGSLTRIEGSAAQYRRLDLTGEERRAAAELTTRLSGLKRLLEEAFASEDQLVRDAGRLVSLREELEGILKGDIQSLAYVQLGTAKRGAERAFASVIYTIRFLVPAFVLCCLVSAILLIQLIREPVTKLMAGTAEVAAGNLNHRISARSRDEFGDLARNFNRMVEELQATTVSKEVLEASDARLREANRALEAEVVERRRAESAREQLLAAEQAARADAEAAQGRLSFLAHAGALLAASLNYESTLQGVTRAAVPYLADCCFVDLTEADGEVRRVATCCADPEQHALSQDIELCRALTTQALFAGRPEVLHQGEDPLDPRLGACMSVPMMLRGRTLGAITFLSADLSRRYTGADVHLAEDLAWRAALAVESGRLYHAVEEADHRKNEFLAMLGHELRNPLGAISNAVHLLQQEAHRPASPATREVLARQVHQMSRLVDDLLEVSRITRGKVELRKELVDLGEEMRQAAKTARALFEVRRHHFTLTVPDEPLWVEADPTRLEQVVTNLLNNAAKYTPDGGTIELLVERIGSAPGEAVIRVRDNGIGISPHVLPHVFDLFSQAENSLDRALGGLGIGLTLVRSLVHLHGGSVAANSEGLGRGSEFIVRLPLSLRRPRAFGAPEGRPTPVAAEDTRMPRKVLLVDDNVDAAETLAEILEGWGCSVSLAHDGPSAVERALAQSPEAVLLDIGLPGIDGYEVARRLRRSPGFEATRLLALTGYAQPDDALRAREAGFDAHLTKPVDLEILRDALRLPFSTLRPRRGGGLGVLTDEAEDE
jgi:signal transduction histidine kinase/ActR/RegA family two-component response regulator/HAMP domain-containing protein